MSPHSEFCSGSLTLMTRDSDFPHQDKLHRETLFNPLSLLKSTSDLSALIENQQVWGDESDASECVHQTLGLCVFKSREMIIGDLTDTESEECQTLKPIVLLKEMKLATDL